MRADGVVVTPPCLDQHLSLREAVEDLAVKKLVPKRAVEALVIAVLPRRAGRDVECLHADFPQPLLDRGRDELATIVRPDMRWWTSLDEEIGECCQHILMLELTRNDERQTFPAGLIDDG